MFCVYKVLEFSNRVVKKEKQFLVYGILGFVEEVNINIYIFNIVIIVLYYNNNKCYKGKKLFFEIVDGWINVNIDKII